MRIYIRELEDEVNYHLSKGATLVGGIFIHKETDKIKTYCQAVLYQ